MISFKCANCAGEMTVSHTGELVCPYCGAKHNLSDKELERLENFRERHYKKCAEPLHSKNVGNTYIYDLIGTGIGTIIKVTCPLCGESEDITDTSSW